MAPLAAAILLTLPATAAAAPPDFVTQVPGSQTAQGAGAGELNHPRGVAGEPETGHLFVADRRNARVSEYSAWGLFVKSWGWGVADGANELQTCGPAEPEEDPDPSLCQKGHIGAGKGQMAFLAGGIAVDGEGNIWLGDLENRRVQKFSPAGEFLLMLGGDVNKTKAEEGAPAAQRNVCPVAPTDVCQAGTPGEGPSQLSGIIFDVIDYSSAENEILVGDQDGIQIFDLDGGFKGEIAFEGPLASFAGRSVSGLDVDEDGNIYFSLSGVEDAFKLSSSGAPLAPGKPGESKFDAFEPRGVAVDVQGSVYVIDDPPGASLTKEERVTIFDASGNRLVPTGEEEDELAFFPYVPFLGPALTGLGTNLCSGSDEPGSLYVGFFSDGVASYVDIYGTPPIGCEDPPLRPPEIVSQFVTSAGRHEATIGAQINPRFWPDTTYYVEYGTGKCSEGGCEAKAPIPPALLTSKSVNGALTAGAVALDGLEPGVVYRYRVVAESSGGGPVFGVDPDGRAGPLQASPEQGLEGTFRTFAPPAPLPPCPNDAVRVGPSAKLPDCRAYEMVSPLDKGGGDVALWMGARGQFPHELEIHQSAPSGQRFTYSSEFGFAGPEGVGLFSQYMATRGASGWTSEALSPLRTIPTAVDFLDGDFRGFSQDLCEGWLRLFSLAPLSPGAVEEYPNLYRRETCGDSPPFQALTTVEPPNRAPDEYQLEFNGASDDGTHALFTANDVLVPGVPLLADRRELTLYERTPEEVRFVCYLPNGTPSPLPCAAGVTAGGAGETPVVHNAISADGSRIFWTAYEGTPGVGEVSGVPGQIYVRLDGAETREVSTAIANDPAWYWTASGDGSKVVFEFYSGPLEDRLYEFDVDTGTPTLIAKEVEGPMGYSEDATRIYFASREDLDESGPATAGGHNLYLYEASPGGGEGEFSFIMALAEGDLDGEMRTPSPVEDVPIRRTARVPADGLHALFASSASPSPTGYDNVDVASGEPAQEVYLYDAVEGELHCVSCNPTGARPVAENIGTEVRFFFAAARIQGWEAFLRTPRVLSEDGTRVFFESFEALVPRDTNSTWDVYQWEEEGEGTCEEDSETFVLESGGCVDLISSGLSAARSTFLDADPSGDSIFFSTQSSLVGQDYGLNDVYVARVGGGFLEPQEEEECEGAACQSPPPPPPGVTPSSELSQGPGNVPARRSRPRRCPKGKRRVRRAGKVRCVKRGRRPAARRRG